MEEPRKITHEKFGAMLERISSNGFKLENWFPTMDEARRIAESPIENYEFALWIVESNPDRPLTPEQQEVEKFLQKMLMNCTEFI